VKRNIVRLMVLAGLAICAQGAWAHPGHDKSGAAAGFVHPFTGVDHLLAMIAVGLWACQLGGRARWTVPVSFVGAMVLGGLLAATGMKVGIAEPGILTSVLVLGLLVAMAVRLPIVVAGTIVASFAMFHGYAHVVEMRQGDSIASYAAGFVAATAMLHAIGLGMGLLIEKTRRPVLLRLCGGVVVLGAMAIWIGIV
jgi:urease accessory protein